MTFHHQQHRNVLIVAANQWAYHCFWTYAAYVCQADRPFRHDIGRLGYYVNGAIQREFPAILARRKHVSFDERNVSELKASGYHLDAAFATVIERMLTDGREEIPGQVFLLSASNDPLTLYTASPIPNDKRGKSGRITAWTQGQARYVAEAVLLSSPSTTSELDYLQEL